MSGHPVGCHLQNRRLAWPLKWYGACPCRALEKQASPEEGAPSKEVLELRKELFMKLGWDHWARQESDRLRTCFPTAYPLF